MVEKNSESELTEWKKHSSLYGFALQTSVKKMLDNSAIKFALIQMKDRKKVNKTIRLKNFHLHLQIYKFKLKFIRGKNEKRRVVIAILLSFVLLFSLVPLNNLAKAKNGYGLVIINGKQMYKSKYGNLYPIVILNGKKYVKWYGFELTPVEDVIACESGKSDAMLGNFINKYVKEHGNNIDRSKNYNSNSSEIRWGYNQTYWKWSSVKLGFSNYYTIGNAGCFLCSTASELLRYGLKEPVSHNDVDLVNLNNWLKSHNGFSGESGADLNYSAIGNFFVRLDSVIFRVAFKN